jgi:hypothetical protein
MLSRVVAEPLAKDSNAVYEKVLFMGRRRVLFQDFYDKPGKWAMVLADGYVRSEQNCE